MPYRLLQPKAGEKFGLYGAPVNGTTMRYLASNEQLALAQSARDGDEHAFGVLYEHFVKAITGHVAGRLSNIDDVKDLVADCFTKALRALREDKYDTRYSFYTFLRAIADNEIRHYLKQRYIKIPGEEREGAFKYRPKLVHIMDHGAAPPQSWEAVDQTLQTMPAQDVESVAWELLRIVLSNCLKPHQGLAFGFIRFLEWRPREILDQLSDSMLLELSNQLYHDFGSLFPSNGTLRSDPRDHCPGFWDMLEKAVAQIYVEPEYAKLLKPPRTTGELLLGELYGHNPSASLSDWCDKVRNRARKAMHRDI